MVKAALEHLPWKIAATGVNALVLDTLYRLLPLSIKLSEERIKEAIVRFKGYLNKKLVGESVAEFSYQPGRSWQILLSHRPQDWRRFA